jgi:hypothetical protein
VVRFALRGGGVALGGVAAATAEAVRQRARLGLRRHAQRPPPLPQPEQHALQQPVGRLLLLKQRHAAVVVRAHVAFHALESGEALHEGARGRGEVAILFEGKTKIV